MAKPPAWMKTNGKPTGGGKEKASIKDGMGLECAEYIWGYLQHMAVHQQPTELAMQIEGKQFAGADVRVVRTNAKDSCDPGDSLKLVNGRLTDRLAPFGLVTYELQVKK